MGLELEKSVRQLIERSYSNYVKAETGQAGRRLEISPPARNYMVTGAGGFGCVGEYSGRKRKKMGTECTAAERLEIEANYAFFKEAMKKELEIFYSAFANKNNLFPPADKVKPRSIEELSPEEKAYYAKVGLMAEGMERHTLRKAIAAGETE